MSDDRLLAPCTADLLRGWTGPVHGYVHRGIPTRAVSIGEFTPEGLAILWTQMGDGYASPGSLSLDLSLAECRDRVARVLAAALFRDVPPFGDGLSWRWQQPFRAWDLCAWNRNWTASFADDRGGWIGAEEGNRTGRFPSRTVPALAALDPSADVRLGDGSRLVDALALAAVWREVSRVG